MSDDFTHKMPIAKGKLSKPYVLDDTLSSVVLTTEFEGEFITALHLDVNDGYKHLNAGQKKYFEDILYPFIKDGLLAIHEMRDNLGVENE